VPDVVAIALRFLHIMFAIAWVGAVIFGVVVLRVVMPKVEPPSRKAVLLRLLPVNLRYVPLTATFTITFGVLLYAYLDYFNPVNIDALLRVKLLLVALFLAVGTLSFGMAVPLRASTDEACQRHQCRAVTAGPSSRSATSGPTSSRSRAR